MEEINTLFSLGQDMSFADPNYYKQFQHHHHPLVQVFDPITFTFTFIQQNTFFIYLTFAMSAASVLFNVWLAGLLVFEYDKDNLILDQHTREKIPANKSSGGNKDDIFPNRDFNTD